MKTWELGYGGFVMQYMTAGPGITDFSSGARAGNQLDLEGILRKEVSHPHPESYGEDIVLGGMSENGCPWSVWAPYGSCFVDVSEFYSTLQRIDLRAATVLRAERDMEVRARVWTYMAAGIYLNGKLIGEIPHPVYKPIQCLEMRLSLKKGRNLLSFLCENLGVRDTRNILGVQLLDSREEIRVELPDTGCQEAVYEDAAFLAGLTLKGETLFLPSSGTEHTFLCPMPDSPDYEVMKRTLPEIPLKGLRRLPLPKGISTAALKIRGRGYELCRVVEAAERKIPEFLPPSSSPQEHWRRILKRIASVESLNRWEFGFPISNILARKALGKEGPKDRELLFETLRLIEERVDCSDFLLCGLFRYMRHYEMDEALKTRTKEVLLNFRYWMDMEGTDACCFWSENHSLMFYLCAMEAGRLYPDELFPRAHITGWQLWDWGRGKVLEWLEDVEEYGFEEFLSMVYMCVTFAALLNAIDFTGEDISRRARGLADRLFRELALHTFKGSVIAPMGRIYREVIYPFCHSGQSLINLADPSAPYTFGEGWLAFLATSSYQLPEDLKDLMRKEACCSYTSGNARIQLEKNGSYCLTSVQSPREKDFKRWINVRGLSGADTTKHLFTKSLNECFHGTTCFEPGVYGYQQHMWHAALSPEAAIFANHPGSSSERSDMRPGYWFGNGVMPAIRQLPGIIGAVYSIPEYFPIQFTHVYCPLCRFDETRQERHWLFLKKDGAYLALWCSGALTPYNDTLFDCEFRVYERKAAYVCIAGKREDFQDLDDFSIYAKGIDPGFDPAERRLWAAGDLLLEYEAGHDHTQYIE
ncbi:hypothetical protein [Lacrimispora sp. 210928-DFI.3.58]|uniref:hypothetical protein n=1 Tax=Lacrimispora sp. 210928-DFI.3.58 TaxID=2883214 RepID=UPI001D085DBF|nr:hypothetical protein [Lacrimispora sp. 210928-DFI.3.58]MCB7319001.1 hypothetical protein [Lacrimispora sp. 210928-DFI.3.58]